MDQDATCYGGRSRPRSHCIRWLPSSPPKGAWPPIFGQRTEWIKMSYGTEVGLGPSHNVCVNWDPALSPATNKGTQPSKFRPMSVVAKRLDGTMALSMEVGLAPRHVVLDGRWGSSSPKRDTAPVHFRPIFVVEKRLDGWKRHLVRK